ncbi:DUF2285 domain-containing protein [Brucella sp. NBRC 113783]|uniref:DUF2285 domain-containing protein n=1 Tax=Brucella sp. NBRC 113783 TaxID=3075478 RepID=UPI0029C0003B|nr:DUF2285 domain-containing protein [Brucella sp. NBRC 113783]MDX4074143.1 DUF2285 domain-containing protein [Brucella sp. NBRC 113783]
MTPLLPAGGCDFAHDPDAQPDGAPPFWSPHFNPQAIILSPVEQNDADGGRLVALAHLHGLILRRAPDGWHAIWRIDGMEHQFWLPQGAIDAAAFYAAILPMDEFMELRADAARRLWRCLTGRSPGPSIRVMPAQLRQWHLLSLRALDARLYGESYRAIAEVLLGFRGNKEDFETDPRKNKARRLVAHGIRMMRGGYRLLLHYPVKPIPRSKGK